MEDEIVRLRKRLEEEGLDAGPHTIAYHLRKGRGTPPAPSTIWRILTRRGFVIPKPQKRPKSSFVRFQAEMPNERWQADITHWELADGSHVEILNIVDDHSRLPAAAVGARSRSSWRRWGSRCALHPLPPPDLREGGAVESVFGLCSRASARADSA